jgi:hypothetical protein
LADLPLSFSDFFSFGVSPPSLTFPDVPFDDPLVGAALPLLAFPYASVSGRMVTDCGRMV